MKTRKTFTSLAILIVSVIYGLVVKKKFLNELPVTKLGKNRREEHSAC
jgi:hypothetical protein